MGTTTTTFALNKPTVGGDDNAWGTDWNTNADKLDDLLDGTTAIKPNLTEGQWKVGGVAVTSSAAELNILDGATLTVTELNYVDGVTSAIQTQLDGKQAIDADLTAIAALAGTSGLLRKTAADTWSLDTSTFLTGNQTITLSGDLSGSGSTAISATIANGAVTTAKLATGAAVADQANATAGGVGTYVWATRTTGTADVTFGTTLAGSSLSPTSAARSYVGAGSIGNSATLTNGSALSGTWQCMGNYDHTVTATTDGSGNNQTLGGSTLWLRIS